MTTPRRCAQCGKTTTQPAVCLDCGLKLALNLDWIDRNYPTLADHLEPTIAGQTSRSVPASRPPLRAEVLSLAARGGISGLLGSWVQLLLEEHPDRELINLPDPRCAQVVIVNGLVTVLRKHTDWLLDQDYADDYASEITKLALDMALLTGQAERSWEPLPGRWTCPLDISGRPCGGRLRQRVGQWRIKCPTCKNTWDGEAEIIRLGLIVGSDPMVTVAQAALFAGVHRTTVWRWIDAGILPVASGRVDRRDVAALVTRRVG